MSDTASQYVLAMAYISRHNLAWRKTALGKFYVAKIEDIGVFDMLRKMDIVGEGWSLYGAVKNYQDKIGIGWGQ